MELIEDTDKKEESTDRITVLKITMFKTLGIGLDIVIFAIIGYLIGKEYGNEILGMMIGAIVGTIFMWIHLFIVLRRLGREMRYKKRSL
ncbi:MAG: hypothetical protein DRJ49_04515 [Thermoprotei archaeon]|nr:MAG: hypothetical protein DRJ49_04515 [Thermoprotei archaeon]